MAPGQMRLKINKQTNANFPSGKKKKKKKKKKKSVLPGLVNYSHQCENT